MRQGSDVLEIALGYLWMPELNAAAAAALKTPRSREAVASKFGAVILARHPALRFLLEPSHLMEIDSCVPAPPLTCHS